MERQKNKTKQNSQQNLEEEQNESTNTIQLQYLNIKL